VDIGFSRKKNKERFKGRVRSLRRGLIYKDDKQGPYMNPEKWSGHQIVRRGVVQGKFGQDDIVSQVRGVGKTAGYPCFTGEALTL